MTSAAYRTAPEREQSLALAPLQLPALAKPPSRMLYRLRQRLFVGVLVTPPVLLSALALIGVPDLQVFGGLSFVGLIGLEILLVKFTRSLRLGRELDQRALQAIRLLEDDPASALDEFAALASRSRGLPFHHSVQSMNVAVAVLRLGHAARAREILDDVERAGWFAKTTLQATLARNLVTTTVLEGDLKSARSWLTVAETATPAAQRHLLIVGRALLAARAGRFQECIRLVDEGWNDASRVMTKGTMGALKVLRAYAAEQHDPDAVAATLDEARSLGPTGFDYWAASWKELDVFLRRHDLLPARPV